MITITNSSNSNSNSDAYFSNPTKQDHKYFYTNNQTFLNFSLG